MRYKLEAVFVPRNGWEWVIKGLRDFCPIKSEELPDTVLRLVGMYHACDTPESIMLGVYRALYDHHQVTEPRYGFADGDEICSEAVVVNKYHSFDNDRGKVAIPPMRFTIHSFHVVMEEPDYELTKRLYDQQEKNKAEAERMR